MTGEETPSLWNRITDFIERSFRQYAERVADEALSADKHLTLNTKKMKKLELSAICALLSIKEFEQADDGTVNMTEDQLRLIENRLAAQDSVLADKQKEIDSAAVNEKNLLAQIEDLTEQVNNLKNADGDDTGYVHQEGEYADDDLAAASEAQASYNRLAGII